MLTPIKPPYTPHEWETMKADRRVQVEYFGNTRVEIFRDLVEKSITVKHVPVCGDKRRKEKWFRRTDFYPY